MKFTSHFILTLCALATAAFAQDTPKPAAALPKVVLLGDSIREGYAPFVAEMLAGKATVVTPKANGRDTGTLLTNLDKWAVQEKPDVVHFNCGIHDTKQIKQTGKNNVPPEQYEANLRELVKRLRAERSTPPRSAPAPAPPRPSRPTAPRTPGSSPTIRSPTAARDGSPSGSTTARIPSPSRRSCAKPARPSTASGCSSTKAAGKPRSSISTT